MTTDPYETYEEALRILGLKRTRENYLWVLYDGNVPAVLDEEEEEYLPSDLRLTRQV